MKVKDLVDNLKKMKKIVGNKKWKKFQETNVFTYIDGKYKKLEFTAVCGSHYEYGIEAVIQNSSED